MRTDPTVERLGDDSPDPRGGNGEVTSPLSETDESGAVEVSSTFLTARPVPTPGVATSPLEGTLVGGVRIRRLIGEGGMGRVYEGWNDELQKSFAVKFIRPGVADPALVSLHMKREAAILARLHHPGIARIFWIGTHEIDGAQVPYFIMEYVAGAQTITQFATHRHLGLRERLELFHQVCDAVAAGHAIGVTHRDLKPLNILVDEDARPKVIDFGIARMTNADLAMTTMDATRFAGTPSHMSPEQFAGGDIDSRTDVYALGVILFQLLAGRPPFECGNKLPYQFQKTVIEDEPPKLATLVPRLPRDVGVIAGHCLQKDKLLRYANAGELRDDIGRFLAGEPILASAPPAWQLIRQFARRHRAVTFATVGVVAAFLIAFAGILVFAIESRIQQSRTERVLGLAIKLLAGIVPQPNSSSDDGRISPVDLLRRHHSEVKTEPDAGARATLLQAIGKSFLDLGEYGEAADASRDAYLLWRSVRGEHASETLGSLSLHTTSLLCMDNIQDAVAQAENLVKGCRSRYEPGHPQVVEALLLLARAHRRTGDVNEALRITNVVVRESAARNGPADRSALIALNNLGVLYSETGRFPDAIECYKKACLGATTGFGREDRDALQFGHNLGVAHLRAAAAAADAQAVAAGVDQQRDEGIRTLQVVCELRQNVLGMDHPETLATLHELAKAMLTRGLAAQVKSIIEPCRDILQRRAEAKDMAARQLLTLLRTAGEMTEDHLPSAGGPASIENKSPPKTDSNLENRPARDAQSKVAASLERSLTLVFSKNSLECASHMIAEEIGVPIEINVRDLQLEGISKNTSFALDDRDKPAEEVLLSILRKTDPQSRLVYVVRARDGVAYIEITTRAAAEKRDDALPQEFHEAGLDSARGVRK